MNTHIQREPYSSLQKKKDILKAIISRKEPSLKDISDQTGIPESTIKRQFSVMRRELNIDVEFIRSSNEGRGAKGYYVIQDWGLLDENEIMKELA